MELNLSYEQIVEIVMQLPDNEKKKLSKTLSVKSNKKTKKRELLDLLLSAPTISDDELEHFQTARDFINSSRIK
jgi:hypothetical protein